MSSPSMAQRIAALQKMRVPELVVEYEHAFGEPPHCKNRVWLWRNVAWKIQELHYGGLPADARARLEQIIDEHIRPRYEAADGGQRAGNRPATGPSPGTMLTREWRGQQITLRVAEDGTFVWNGAPYRSLSAVAKAVTGQHWSGTLFFGLRKRSKKAPAA